jgi:hypothetical protein
MSEWLTTIPEDITIDVASEDGSVSQIPMAQHPKLQEFAGKDLHEVLKSYIHAQDTLGKAIKPLPEKATEEQRTEFMQQLRKLSGVPDTVEGYELSVDEIDEVDTELVDWFKHLAYELGIPPTAAQKLLAGYNSKAKELWETFEAKQSEAVEAARQEALATLSKTFGGEEKAKEAAEIAKRGFEVVGAKAKLPEEVLVDFKKQFGNNPAFVQVFHAIGSMFTEDNVEHSGTHHRASNKATLAQTMYPNMNP